MLTSKKYKNCPFCGEKILYVAVKCRYCGSLLGVTNVYNEKELFSLHSKILGRKYDLIEIIGKGGMATVYKAYHKYLKRFEAIKVLNQEFSVDLEVKERFFREAQLISYLEHPNIVKIFDIDTFDQITFIAMEYINGEDLYSLIKKGFKFDLESFIKLFLQIVDALSHAHEKGIIHRDIKSSNILLQYDEEHNIRKALLTDFGIAYVKKVENILGQHPLTQKGEIFGTPEFMSPEQVSGDENVDERSDIFSVGVVMYHTLTNLIPFNDTSVVRLIFKVVNSQYTPLNRIRNDLPVWLINLVHKCLEPDKNKRFSSCDEIKAILNEKLREIKDTIYIDETFSTIKLEQDTFNDNSSADSSNNNIINTIEKEPPQRESVQNLEKISSIVEFSESNEDRNFKKEFNIENSNIEKFAGGKPRKKDNDKIKDLKSLKFSKTNYNKYNSRISKPILISSILAFLSAASLIIYFLYSSTMSYTKLPQSKYNPLDNTELIYPSDTTVDYEIVIIPEPDIQNLESNTEINKPDRNNLINTHSIDLSKKNFLVDSETSEKDTRLLLTNSTDLIKKTNDSISSEENNSNSLIETQLSVYLFKRDYDNLIRVYGELDIEQKKKPEIVKIINLAYQNIIKLGDESLAKKMYNEALIYYSMAQKLKDDLLVRSKKLEVERILKRER